MSHTLADLTPMSEAVAGLLLPSAFHQDPAGQWVLDHTLLTSAEVTTTAPFTVTYRIRRNAQWSDITPIAAEDFGYLAEQMRTQPGSRGEIVLERNDRYWDTPTQVGRIRLRQGSEAALVEALRTGGAQGALFGRPNAITESLLRAADLGVSPTVVPQPVLVSVLLRPASRVLSDQRMRTAVAAVLDRASLIATGVGSGPSAALRADSEILAPSAPDYHPTVPATGVPVAPDPDAARRLLTEAGYTRGPAGWQRAGQLLRLVVAAPANREPYGTLAARVVAQLRTAGIDAELREIDPDELFSTLLGPSADAVSPRGGTAQMFPASVAAPDIDIAVLPQPAAGHPATQLESWYGCPLVVPARLAPAPPNPAQFCDLALQPMIERALTQEDPAGAVSPTVEAALWERVVTIPLYQPASLLMTNGQLPDVAPGTPLEGPLDGAARWQLRP
ncbi:MAG: ABC transporter substrate-binding protein [Pseudonocardia sp.]|nr:ABC transporter substrate-binding protein [Pseudonocardia sp.]